jgi:hypothetical protein
LYGRHFSIYQSSIKGQTGMQEKRRGIFAAAVAAQVKVAVIDIWKSKVY